MANSFSITGPRFDNYAAFKAEARLVHNFVCSTRQTLPHVFEPEVMGLMAVMETLAGKKRREKWSMLNSNFIFFSRTST